VVIVEIFRQLWTQRLIALVVVPANDSFIEQHLLSFL